MKIDPKRLKLIIDEIKLLSIIHKGRNYRCIFDKVNFTLFNPCSKYLKEFGIVPKYIPNFLRIIYFIVNKRFENINIKKYNHFAFDVIDLGPFYNTRGMQIKIYDIANNYVICSSLNNEISDRCSQAECDIYNKYGGERFIPKLIGNKDNSYYIREYIYGKKLKNIPYHKLKTILTYLNNIYKLENNYRIKLNIYVKDLKSNLNGLLSNIEVSFSNSFLNNSITIVKCHGDFAAKNILINDDKYYLIDWERSSMQSLFYDLMNYIFKLKPKNKESLDNILKSIKEHNIDSTYKINFIDSLNENVFEYYKLFLLERLCLEKYLYKNNSLRFKVFYDIWKKHLKILSI